MMPDDVGPVTFDGFHRTDCLEQSFSLHIHFELSLPLSTLPDVMVPRFDDRWW